MKTKWLSALPALLMLLAGVTVAQPPPQANDPAHDAAIARAAGQLSVAQAVELENRIDSFPNHRDVHLQLALFWMEESRRHPSPASIQARRRHVLWLLNSGPADPFFRRSDLPYGFVEDKSQDREGSTAAVGIWEKHLARLPNDSAIARNAAEWLKFTNPERALELLRRANDRQEFGRFCAAILLGMYQENTVNGLPDTPLTRAALAEIDQSEDPAFLAAAISTLDQLGATRHFAKSIAFDYSGPLKKNLPRLRRMKEVALQAEGISDTFPPAKPPMPSRIRVGGNLMHSKIKKRVQPNYPSIAREYGIQGTVRLNVIVSRDGNIIDAQVVAGPDELRAAAMDAVKQWEYEPTLLNGTPVEVVTVIDVTFSLRARAGFRGP